MRSKVVKTLALALVLSGGISLAQQPPAQPGQPQQPAGKAYQPGGSQGRKAPPEKSKLEEMLAEALKNNPDIRVAAAKLAEAEAQLNRTRVQVTQQAATLYQAILSQKAVVDYAQKRFDRMKGLLADRAIDAKLVEEESDKLMAAKAKVAELEAQMPGLLGKTTRTEDNADAVRNEALRIATRHALEFARQQPDPNELEVSRLALAAIAANQHKTTGPMAERIRKALQTQVKVNCNDMTLDDILAVLAKQAPRLSFRNVFPRGGGRKPHMSLQFEEALPVSAILQALADEVGCLFLVRDYGILVTKQGEGPPGALTVEEFLRHKPADEARPQSRDRKNPPPDNVEGVVKAVNASGLMTITIGSDAGLAKGHTLELFRLVPAPSQSKYLGTVRILEVEAHQAVAQSAGRLSSPPQSGDHVASRILEK